MKKLTIICISLFLGTCLMTSCDKSASTDKGQSTEKKATAKKKSDKKAFLYTAQHRKDKYQVTEPILSFSKKLGSANEGEFEGNEYIEEVYFNDQFKHIMNRAFANCKNLREIHFAAPIPVINDEAFIGCSSLKNLICDAYTVGLSSFEGCTSLENVRFGDHMYWIRENSFAGCKNLKSILMGITLEKLDEGAFPGCTAVEEFSVPQAMKNRMFGYFADCPNLKRVYILSTEFFPVPKNCTPKADCTLYVPDAYLKQFQGDAEWSKFEKIVPLSESKHFTAEGFWKK